MASSESNVFNGDGQGVSQTQSEYLQREQQQQQPQQQQQQHQQRQENQQQLQQQQQQTEISTTPPELEGCGCGSCQPKCLQPLAKPIVYLLSVCFLVFTQAFLVTGYTNSILTSIERRYNLRSSEAGLIAGSYDMTSILALIVVSYLGDSYNRCKWMGAGAIIMSIGTAIFIFPHFLGGPYKTSSFNTTNSGASLCNISGQSGLKDIAISPVKLDCSVQNPETWALAIFIIAQLTIGIGTAPIFTLGPTYLYDNVKSSSYSIYAGIMYSMAALGPALGFLAGGFFLTFYVDFITSPTAKSTVQEEHWVGAWWMGFIVCSGMSLLTAFPLLLFPKKLPCSKSKKEERAKQGFCENIREFPVHTWRLVKNSTWLAISFTFVCEQSISTGFVTFMAKYLQVNFAFTASRANIITGMAVIPAAFLGIILGGIAMKHLKLSLQGITKFMLLLNIVPTLGVVSLLFMGCSNVDMAGVTTHYSKFDTYVAEVGFTRPNLTSPCNSPCTCRGDQYDPVCGSDRRTYFSPCHAGCAAKTAFVNAKGNKDVNYTSCGCMADGLTLQQASSGRCGSECQTMIPFILVIFVVVLFTSLGHNPLLLITLRCVDPRSRSFSLGMQTVLFKLLASIPAPIYFGRIFDSTCLVSAKSCDDSGACLLYDLQKIPYLLFGTVLGLKCLTFLCITLTYLSLRCSKKMVYEVDGEGQAGDGLPLGNIANCKEPTVSVIATYLQQTS